MNQLIADTINGVYPGEAPSEADVLIGQDFLDALSTCKDTEVLYGLVDDDIAAKIEAEYGIR